tara:strand:- start:452 stop:937 length:486 start_codon:yes stop_codon:yes gene_type:complete
MFKRNKEKLKTFLNTPTKTTTKTTTVPVGKTSTKTPSLPPKPSSPPKPSNSRKPLSPKKNPFKSLLKGTKSEPKSPEKISASTSSSKNAKNYKLIPFTIISTLLLLIFSLVLGILLPKIITEYLVKSPDSTFLEDARESAYEKDYLLERLDKCDKDKKNTR